MSEMGQNAKCPLRANVFRYAPHKRTSTGTNVMSEKCHKLKWPPLFDHRIGARHHVRRHLDAERLRGLEVDHQFEFGRRLHRQVGGLFSLEDAIDVASGT